MTSARAIDRGDARQVRIVPLDAATLTALADGDLTTANLTSPVPLTACFADVAWRGVWRMRSAQVTADASVARWVTGAVWDTRLALAVGRAGFHDAPDAAGMVEVGYAIDPALRRRGYGRAALEALLARADADPDIRVVRACISPTNVASLALATAHGFAAVGEEWDEVDGLEIVHERPAT
ncbi:GNAT family N-acetyltransferase [Cellulomonas sp. P22]|uniref:GNAT family N-acetyltransferase n=1 Tax=Cellulomonas sp. P22 TaxID=3373189 RepID=UPI0037882740